VINTDASAITTTSTASGSLQVVDQRVFTTSTSTLALGFVHQGATISGPTVGVTSTGLNATTANGTLGSFTGGPSDFSLGLASGSAQFYGASASQTATYSIAGTASTLGSLNGTYTSAVTAEFGSIPNVTVAVTGQVYSGQATWNTNGSGNWGTIAGAGVNAFGLNWGANQGSPGLDPSYTNTDTATFGSSLTSGTAVISTNGANISLKAMTFNNANASYTILQSGGSSPIGLVGSGTNSSAINAVAGSHTINSNLSLGSALVVDVSAGASLTLNNAISGTSSDYSLTKAGVGTLYLNGDNSYLGGTIVEAGTLRGVGSVAGLMTVRNGAEFAVGQEAAFGVFEVGALTLEAGSRTSLLISGTTAGTDYDQIASAGGSLSYGGILDLTLSGSYALGTSFSLFEGFASHFGTLTDVMLSTSLDSPYSGLTFSKSVFGTDVVWWTNANTSGQSLKFTEGTGTLVVVPEPSTVVIASIGAALAGLWRMRRRKVLRLQA
jgi:autotransporter-associated beta strand protein